MKRSIVAFLIALLATCLSAAQTQSSDTKEKKSSKKNEVKKSEPEQAAPIHPGAIKFSDSKAGADATATNASPLVQAARSGSQNRGKSKLSISNSDVKKSTGKLTLVSTRTGYTPETAAATSANPPNTADEAARLKQRRDAAKLRLDSAKKEVADLEKELARLEDDYYSEDNIDYRDNVLEERFDKTKKQLEKAREALAAARDEAQKSE